MNTLKEAARARRQEVDQQEVAPLPQGPRRLAHEGLEGRPVLPSFPGERTSMKATT